MTVAPTSEMASGVKMKTLARDSRRMRSKRAAVSRPRPTLPDVATRSQRTLLRRISRNGARGEARPVGERERALLVLEAADHGDDRRIDEVDRQQHHGRRDEDPRQDAVADPGRQALDQRARAREQEPDPADADEQRDGREQELGEELIALPVPQRLGARGVAEQVVDRGEELLTALRVDQDRDADGRERPARSGWRPARMRDEPYEPDPCVRSTATSPLRGSCRNSSGAPHRW